MHDAVIGHHGQPGRVQTARPGRFHHFRLHNAKHSGIPPGLPAFQHVGYPDAEGRMPGGRAVQGFHHLGIQGRALEIVQLLGQIVIQPPGHIARIPRKARVRPMNRTARHGPVSPDRARHLIIFRRAGVDHHFAGHHMIFAVFGRQILFVQILVIQCAHTATTAESIGRMMRPPKRIIIAENLAMERPVMRTGTAVQDGNVHPPGAGVGIGQHGPVAPGHVGRLHILIKNQGQPRGQIPAHQAHFARFRIDDFTLAGPALAAKFRAKTFDEILLRPALAYGARKRLPHVPQQIHAGHAGHGQRPGASLFPQVMPAGCGPDSQAFQVGHGVAWRQAQGIAEIRLFLRHGPHPPR